jgi:TP901 family phage tail tape measure protein
LETAVGALGCTAAVFYLLTETAKVPGFNIVAQVQLQGPTNIAAVAQQISSGLSNISANVNVNVNNASLGALQGLGNTIGQLNTSLGALVNASNTASGAVSNLGGSMSRTSAGASVVQQSARTATTSLKSVTTAFQEAEAAGEQFGKSAGLALRRFAGFTLAAGTVFAVVDSFKHGIEQAILFEREMNKLEQVNAGTVTQIKEVERAISSLSTTFGTSSQSLAQAAVLLGSAGLKADDVTKSLEALAKSAASPQFGNLIDTTNGVIAIMSQFKVPASEIEKSLGAINSVSNAFSTESGDLIEAIKRSGGAFRATGGDLNEFLALFTSVRATTRESAESIATGLRTIFTRFQTPQTVNALKEMGINLRFSRSEAEQLGKLNLTDQFVGPYEAVRRLSAALKDLPTTDPRFAAIIDQLGGYRQISRVIPLIQEFGTAQRAYATAQSGALSITAASEKAQESYAVQIAKTKETFLELTRTIVGSEGFRVFLDGLLKIANAAVILLNALGPLIPLLTTLAAIRIGAAIPGFIAGFAGGFRGEQPKRLAIGGVVPGVGNTDTVPAMLTPGEFVVRKESAQRIGYSNLSKLNSGGQVKVKNGVQYLAKGGAVINVNGNYGGLFLQGEASQQGFNEYGAGGISSENLEALLSKNDFRESIREDFALKNTNLALFIGKSGYQVRDRSAGNQVVADIPVKFLGKPGVHILSSRASERYKLITRPALGTVVRNTTNNLVGGFASTVGISNSGQVAEQALYDNGIDSILGHTFEATLVGIAGSAGQRIGSKAHFDLKKLPSESLKSLSNFFDNISEPYLDVRTTANPKQISGLIEKALNERAKGNNDFSLSYNRAFTSVGDIKEQIIQGTEKSRKGKPVTLLARGGVVPGVGDTDSVPAQLMPGEFVIRKSSAQKIGYDALSSLNNFGGQIRKFEQGGNIYGADISNQNIDKAQEALNSVFGSNIKLRGLFSRLLSVGKTSGLTSSGFKGSFYPASKTVLLGPQAGLDTVAHEAVHAASRVSANQENQSLPATVQPQSLFGQLAEQSLGTVYEKFRGKKGVEVDAQKYAKAGQPHLLLDEALANAFQAATLHALGRTNDPRLQRVLADPASVEVLNRVKEQLIPELERISNSKTPLQVNRGNLRQTYEANAPNIIPGLPGFTKRASGGPVLMAFGGDPTFLYNKKESLTYSELEALGLGKEDLEQFKKIGAGELTEVSKIDQNKKEQKLKTLQLPLFPTERFAMIYRGDASTAGLDRVHFSSVKGLPKLSKDAEKFLVKYQDLPPKGLVEGVRARFDKHVFSEQSSQDFSRIQLKVRSYLNNLFKEEFPSSTIPLNVKQKTLSDISGGIFETYVSGLSQIPIAGNNETFDISNARIQASEINKVLYPKLQTGLADIKLSGSNNNITSMINKIFNYEVAQGGDKAIDTAGIGLAPGEVLGPPLSQEESRAKQVADFFKRLGLPVPPRRKASGGLIDSVPALLTPGEFVINRESASRIGLPELNRMNVTGRADGGTVQKFARGGPVQPQKFATGGTTGSLLDDFKQVIQDFINNIKIVATGKNPNIEREQLELNKRQLGQDRSSRLGETLRGKSILSPGDKKDTELQTATENEISKRTRGLAAQAVQSENLGKNTLAPEGSRLRDIQTQLYTENRESGLSSVEARKRAVSEAEILRIIEIENQARQEVVDNTLVVARLQKDQSGQLVRTFEFRNRAEVEAAEAARQEADKRKGQQGRFTGFARTDAEREIANRGGAARLSGTSIEAINQGAQARLAQELVQSEVARIRALKLGISSEETERLARENVTNALLLERKVIVDGNTNKRKLADSENLATAKNLELARETEHLTEDERRARLAQKAGVGGASGLQGEIRPGIGDRLKSFLTNPAALAGIAYSATAYAPGLINQAQGGSFEERLPGQVGPRGEVRGDLRERGVAAVGAAGTGLAAGFGAAALGSTLATAGVIGAAAVPPIAIVAGVVAGLLTFTQSLHEQEKQIRSAQLGKALDSLALKINDFNSGKLFGGEAGFSIVGREFQNTETLRRAEDRTSRGYGFGLFTDNTPQKVTSTEEKSLREKVLPQLPGLLQAQEKVLGDIFNRQNAGNVRGGVSLNPNELKGQIDSVLADFLKAGDGFGKQILETTARLKNVPYAEVERETKQQIIAIQNSARVVTNELQARALLSSQLNSLVTFTNSLNGAIISLKEFDDKLSLTGQIVSGNVTGGQVNVRGDVTQAVQSADPDTLKNVLTSSLGILGSRLDTLRTPITELNRAYRELPGILSQAGSTPLGPLQPGTFGDKVSEILGKSGFGREITTAITSALDTQFKDPAALQQALTRDIGGLTKELVKSYEPLLQAVASISKAVEGETNKFISNLSQSSRFLEEVNAGLQQQSNLQLQRARVVAENQAIQAGRRGDTGAFISLQQLEAPFNALQQRLSGINGPGAFNPDVISQKLDKTNEELRKADEERRNFVGTPRGDAGAVRFEELGRESNNLQKSLKNLADVSSRAAGVQEKLTQLQADRESRLSFGERVITADPAQQAQIQRGLALINITAQRRSAEGLTQPDLRLLFETIHSLGQTRLPVAGNVTAETFGKDLVERIGTSIFPKGTFTPQAGAQKEETELRKTLTEYFDDGIEASKKLVQQQSKGYDKFIQDLTRSHNIFLARLEQIELSTLQSTLENQKRQADVEKGLAGNQSKAAEDLKNIFGKGFVDRPQDQQKLFDVIKNNQPEIQKLIELQNNLNKGQRGSFVNLRQEELNKLITPQKGQVNSFEVTSTAFNETLRTLITKNQERLGIRDKDIDPIVAELSSKLGRPAGLNREDTQNKLSEVVRDLPTVLQGLDSLRVSRTEQVGEVDREKDKLLTKLGGATPQNQNLLNNVVSNFPKISPLLSQFQSGEQFVKAGERLTAATESFNKFDQRLKDVTKSLEEINGRLQNLNNPDQPQPNNPAQPQPNNPVRRDNLPDWIKRLNPNFQASGGIISGSNTSSSFARGTDTIPAMLTPGEFVVRREAVQQHLPLLVAINNGQVSGENYGGVRHFQYGGLNLQQQLGQDNPFEKFLPNFPPSLRASNPVTRGQSDQEILSKAAGIQPKISILDQQPNVQVRQQNLNQNVNSNEVRQLLNFSRNIDLQIYRISTFGRPSRYTQAVLQNLIQQKAAINLRLNQLHALPSQSRYRSEFISPDISHVQQQNRSEGLGLRIPDRGNVLSDESVRLKPLPVFSDESVKLKSLPVSSDESVRLKPLPVYSDESVRLKPLPVFSDESVKLKPLPVYSDQAVRLKPLPLSTEVTSPKPQFISEDTVQQYQRGRLEREDRIKKLYGYALGGFVGTTDTVPAMLTPGEYVLNRATTAKIGVNNLNKVNYMQEGGVVTGGANAGGSLLSADAIASISNFSGAATGLSRALTTFNGSSEGLTSALKSFPKTITGTFTHNVNVNHNGLEILNTLTPSISEIALRTVNRILGNYIRQNLPGAPALSEENP